MAEPRDGWAKFDIAAKAFAAVGLPIIVGVLGYLHNEGEREAARRDLAQRDSLAREERRADRVTSLLGHLASANERERVMAIRVAEQLGAEQQLPSEMVPVLRDLATGGQTESERAAAGDAVRTVVERRDALIRELFAPDAPTRIAASRSLVQSWRSDPELARALLDHAEQRLDDANGTFNTLGVLAQLCPAGTAAERARIDAYLRRVRASPVTGPRIRELAGQVERCR